MGEEINMPLPHYVTCRCQHCDGGIEFDAADFEKGETRTVECPHCHLDTILAVPEQKVSPVVIADRPTPQPLVADDKRYAEVQGSIGYFGLADWWLNVLSEGERAYIVSLYQPREAKALTEGTFTLMRRMGMGQVRHSSGLGFYLGTNCIEFLRKLVAHKPTEKGKLSNTITSDKDYALRTKIIRKMIELLDAPNADPVDNIFSIRTHSANQKCNVRYFLGMPASGIDFLQIYGGLQKSITKFAKEHPKEFEITLEEVFAENEKANGSWFERILAGSDRTDYQTRLFPCLHETVSNIPCYNFYNVSDSVTEEICDAIREAENLLRLRLREKRVGEQWDDETELYSEIKREFPELKVIHHGRPDWLGKMHFDVWMPELKIAVEYHGPQHFEAMEHFGGQASLEETKRRDALKRSACAREKVRLFEVLSPNELPQLVKEIKKVTQV